MTLVAIAAVMVSVLSLAHARFAWRAHDRVLLEMIALRIETRAEREGWQQIEHQLEAEELVWRQAAQLHHSARRAMQDAVTTDSSSEGLTGDAPAMRPFRLTADEVQRVTTRKPR